MAEKPIVAATVQIDTDAATKNMLKLKGTVEELRKEFKKAEAGSDEQLAALKKLTAAEEDLAKAQQDLNETHKETAGHFSKIKQALSDLPGAAGAAGQGVTGLSSKFKALLANPVVLVIGAIVAGLTLLVKAFTSTRKGADIIAQGFAYLTGAVNKIVQIVGDFITSITSVGDLLGKIGGFLAHPIDSFKKLGKEIGNAADQAARLKKEEQALERDQINNIGRNRELIKQEEALKNIRDNENNSIKDRIKANEQASALEAERLKTQEALQQRRVNLLKQEIDNAGGLEKINNAQLKAFREAEAELADIQEESIGRENEFITNRVSLQKEGEAQIKEARDKAAEEEKQRQQNLLEYTTKLNKLRFDNYLTTLQDTYAKEGVILRNRIAEEKKQNEQDYRNRKITLEQLNQLNNELQEQLITGLDELNKKRRSDEKAKEEAHQKNIEDLKTKIRLAKITDNRELEKVQLEISYQQQLQETIALYKNNQEQFQEAKKLIDEQYRIDQQKIDKKNAEEDAKKKLEADLLAQENIINDPQSSLEQKQAALDAEQAIIQAAFDKKIITEAEYLAKKKGFSDQEMAIDQAVFDNRVALANAAEGVLSGLSDLFGKQTAAGKAAALAQIAINTALGFVQGLDIAQKSAKGTGPGAAFAFPIFYATQIAAVLGAAAKAKSALASSGSGSGTSASSSAPLVPAAPLAPSAQPVSTTLDQTSINSIGNAAAGGVNAVRAYVVEEDSAAAAARAARLQGAAILGG